MCGVQYSEISWYGEVGSYVMSYVNTRGAVRVIK